MVWILDNVHEQEAIDELPTLSDRAVAIVGATLLESRIEFTIRSQLRQDIPVATQFFKPEMPLGTFGAKIKLGYLMRCYPNEWWQDMRRIGHIRNAFAHDISVREFSRVRWSPSIGQETG